MKINLGMRSAVLASFIITLFVCLFLMNNYFSKKQNESETVIDNLNIDKELSGLHFKSPADSSAARNLLLNFRKSVSEISMIQHETKLYSAVLLVVIFILATTAFIIMFFRLTHPLKELEDATLKIKEGFWDITLPETGLPEIVNLKQSFNQMSRELYKTQNRLVKAEKEMIWKELSRILAHEIKNPLTPIKLSIQRLEEKYYDDKNKFYEIFPDAASIIYSEIKNLYNLVQSFSNFARISVPEKSEFDPSKEIDDIITSYSKSYKLKTELLDGIKLNFDKQHFYQIITNIIQNAIDASPPDGEIAVTMEQSSSYLIVKIKDEGPGIKSEDISKIFEPYFTQKKKGTGLGLALVKRLMETNGGFVRVKNHEQGGACFEMLFETEKRK